MERDARKQIRKYEKLRLKAQEKGDLKEEAGCLNYLGELHTEIGDHEESLSLHKQELGLCHAAEDKIGQAVAHRKVGECYAALRNYKRAVQHQQKHLELAKVSHDLPEQQRAYTTIGRTYFDQGTDFHFDGLYEKAKPCFKEAESAFRTSIRLAQTLQEAKGLPEKEVNLMKTRSSMNLAMVYHYISLEENEALDGDYAKRSLLFHKKAISISQKHMLSEEIHGTNINLVTYYRCRSCFGDAIRHADEALRRAKVARNTQWKIEALGCLADIHLCSGNCEDSRKALKKCFRLTNSSEEKDSIREKLKSIVMILHLQSKIEISTLDKKLKIYEKIADKFAEKGFFQAAINNYKKQEELFPEVESITDKQKAAVYYSLGMTSSDLNDHKTAIDYYKKEMEFYTEPKELAKTWTQIGLCMEKLSKDISEIEDCYNRALEYAEQMDDSKLMLKALNLLLSLQDERKSPAAADTRQKISELQLKSGILVVEGEEDSEEMCPKQPQEGEEQDVEDDIESEDSEALLDKELGTVSSDDSDAEENRKNRMTSKVWKRKLNEKGETPLHRACIEGHKKKVQLLLEQGHPINTPDFAGWTPLHEACIHGFTEIAKALLDHGAHINSTANCGTTSIVDAASNGHLDIVTLLLERGADVTIKNKKGDSALSNLEYWFSTNEEDLDSYEMESYSKVYESLKNPQNNSGAKENNPNPDFGTTLRAMGDLFDAELYTQQSAGPSGMSLTQNSQRESFNRTQRSHLGNKRLERTNFSQVSDFPDPSQRIDDFGPELDPIFNDSQILPTLNPNPRTSKPNRTLDSNRESQLDGTSEYKQAMERLGGSDTLAKLSSGVKSQRAPKRPSTDDLVGLVESDNYVGDDWLIDDLEEVGSNPAKNTKSHPLKRAKTVHLSGSGQTKLGNFGWKKMNSINKSSKDTNSGAFTSSFLNRTNFREKRSSKKLITTKIRDFLPESTDDDVIIEDDKITNQRSSVPNNTFQNSSVPLSSFLSNVQSTPVNIQQPQNPQTSMMRVKVKINGKPFMIAVPGSKLTIGWLCERASSVYKQRTGLQPKLSLYAGGSANEDEACLLSSDDLVCDVLQNNELVTAKIESWETILLSKKYQDACKDAKQVVVSSILSACEQSSTTGKIELKNLGIPCQHLKPLMTSLVQQEITSLQLPGNSLRDDGAASLCEALQKHLTLGSPLSTESKLSELNLRCTNLKLPGLKKLSQAAESGALKDLQTVDISYNRFGDLCCVELATLLRSCKSLKNLIMTSCRFTHKLFQSNYPAFRTAMQGCFSLASVNVSNNLFGSVGVELILKSLPHDSVTTLDISGVGNVANNSLLTRHLTSYLKQDGCQLQNLHLSNNHLSITHLTEFIGELKTIPQLSLRKLDLSRNLLNSTQERRLLNLLAEIESIDEISVDSGHLNWKRNSLDLKERERGLGDSFSRRQPHALFT